MRRPAAWLVGAVLAVSAVVPAGAAEAAAPLAPGAPAGFVPSSTSWTGVDDGFVLGFAGSVPALVHTADGGQTWQDRTAPPVRPSDLGLQVRVFFANARDGLVTDGQALFASHDGGGTWRSVRLVGASGPVFIGALAANLLREYAVVSVGTGDTARTALYSSQLTQDFWTQTAGVTVPGQAVPVSGGWDVVARGTSAAVALGQIFQSDRYWTSSSGGGFQEATPPCGVDARTDLGIAGNRTFALCSSNPGRGAETKQLFAADGSAPFVPLGTAPDLGITRDFAAGSRTNAAIAAAGGGASFVYATQDGGQTWANSLTIEPDRDLFDLAYQDPNHAVFVAGTPTTGAFVARTTNNGQTWNVLTIE
jgi:hypothetical protein